MTESPAKGVKGFILYSPFSEDYFFRVYNPDKSFTDYELRIEELEVEIIGDFASLFEDAETYNKISWASKILKKE